MSTSPFAFLDDPFRSYSSTLLFLSTTALGAALVFRSFMGHRLRRAEGCSQLCSCNQPRKELTVAGRDLVNNVDSEGMESANAPWHKLDSASFSSNTRAGDLFGLGGGGGYHTELLKGIGSSDFTPTVPGSFIPFRGLGETYNDDCSGIGEQVLDKDPDLPDEADEVRREQSERTGLLRRPTRLQKVFVGEVQESVIAQRRRLTLGRED